MDASVINPITTGSVGSGGFEKGTSGRSGGYMGGDVISSLPFTILITTSTIIITCIINFFIKG